VTGAVIGAFVGMNEKRKILGDKMVEERVQVRPRLGVGIFHDDEAGARVLNKNSELAGAYS